MTSRFSNRGGRGVLPLFLILMSLAVPVWASGGDEDVDFDPGIELENAEELIDQGRLDDAIALLVEIARQDPEQMERVQDLILEVRGIKSDVNDLFAELNEAIEAGDETLANAKIREIKARDTDPNRNTLNNLILAAIVVSKAINDGIRDGYFERGNALLRIGDYRGAVTAYRDGFVSAEYLEFYDEYVELAREREEITRYMDDPERQNKIWDAYGTIAPDGDVLIAELSLSLDDWNAASADLPEASASTVAAVGSAAPADWRGITGELEGALQNNEAVMNAARELAARLDETRRRLYSALDNVPEDFRYERIGQFMRGRSGREGTEGILLAQELLWESSFVAVAERMSVSVEGYIDVGRRAYRTGRWDDASAAFSSAVAAADAAAVYAEFAAERIAGEDEDGDKRLSGALEKTAVYESYASAAAVFWSELAQMRATLPAVEDIDFRQVDITRIDELADPIQRSVERTEQLISLWDQAVSDLVLLPGSDGPKPVSIDTALRTDLDEAVSDFRDTRLGLYVNAVIPLFENLENETRQAMEIDVEGIRIRVNGDETAEGELPRRHPSDELENRIDPSLAVLTTAQRDIGDFLDVLEEMLNRQPPIADPEEVVSYRQKAESLLLDVAEYRVSLDDLRSEAVVLANAALRAETSAANALDEAEQDLETAREAVARGGRTDDIDEFYRAVDLYAAVEESLDRVDNLYLEVLVNDVDIAAASGLEERRSALWNDVQADRSRLAVTVKQNAVDEARAAYDEARFGYGVAVLNQSQEFWSRAYGTEDAELAGWLVRLKNAQQALQQTIIEANDPLYAEMNQYLNLANRYYMNGVRLAESDPGNADVLQAFRAAEDLVDQVLNTFPGNEAALLLEQKILRQTDRDTWSTRAALVVNNTRRAVAREDVESLQGDGRQKGLYAEASAINTIEPDFNGLEQVLYDAQVVMGLITPPPDPAVLARSRRLSDEARQIWDNIGAAGADRSMELLDEALTLWLDNREASALKNEILLSSEPERLPPMPAELLNLLVLFDQYFAENNFILAGALIDRAVAEYPSFADDPRIRERLAGVEARR